MAVNTDVDVFCEARKTLQQDIMRVPVIDVFDPTKTQKSLPITSVIITPPSALAEGRISHPHIYAERIGFDGGGDEKKKEPMAIVVKMLRAHQYPGLKKAILQAIRNRFGTMTTKGGINFAESFDFSQEDGKSEEEKGHKVLMKELQAKLNKMNTESKGIFTGAEDAVITNGEIFNTDKHVWRNNTLDVDDKKRMVATFSISDWGGDVEKDAGNTDRKQDIVAKVEANVNARREAIRNYLYQALQDDRNREIAENARTGKNDPLSFSDEDWKALSKINFAVTTTRSQNGESIAIAFGTLADNCKDKNAPTLEEIGATPLEKILLTKKDLLHKAITNYILFAPEAKEIAPLVATTDDLREMLIGKNIKELNELVHNNTILMKEEDVKLKEKNQKPKVMIGDPIMLTGPEEGQFAIRVDIPELPDGIKLTDVVGAMLQPQQNPVGSDVYSREQVKAMLQELIQPGHLDSVNTQANHVAAAADKNPHTSNVLSPGNVQQNSDVYSRDQVRAMLMELMHSQQGQGHSTSDSADILLRGATPQQHQPLSALNIHGEKNHFSASTSEATTQDGVTTTQNSNMKVQDFAVQGAAATPKDDKATFQFADVGAKADANKETIMSGGTVTSKESASVKAGHTEGDISVHPANTLQQMSAVPLNPEPAHSLH